MGEAKFRREGRVKEEHACLCFGGRRGGNPGTQAIRKLLANGMRAVERGEADSS